MHSADFRTFRFYTAPAVDPYLLPAVDPNRLDIQKCKKILSSNDSRAYLEAAVKFTTAEVLSDTGNSPHGNQNAKPTPLQNREITEISSSEKKEHFLIKIGGLFSKAINRLTVTLQRRFGLEDENGNRLGATAAEIVFAPKCKAPPLSDGEHLLGNPDDDDDLLPYRPWAS